MNYAGNRWFWGPNSPSDSFGANGDVYFDTVANSFYYKASGTWGSPFYTITTAPATVAATGITELDFGSTPVFQKTFTVTDASVVNTDRVAMELAYLAPTGKSLDELECDEITFKCVAGAGQFTVFARVLTGLVANKFKAVYTYG